VTPWLYESCLDCNEKLIFCIPVVLFVIPFVMAVDLVAVFVLSVVFL
jgi:cellobiose-specific phosphotransferase system component IIC